MRDTTNSPLRRASLPGLLACACAVSAQAQEALSPGALKRLSIEELMDVEVTSVSRTAQTLSSAAAAVSVVTSEDIRRTGATSIPEALRGIPGITVARRTSSSWAVSSRGFTSINSEKLLVLTDTRSIYTPLFSGVFWDVQDYLMEDIDRIEVIRGPGGSLWGANAVNGVINITTKHAQQTPGAYLEASAGTHEQAGAAARYGGRFSEAGHFRIFGKYSDRDASYKPGATTSDDWRLGHVGFRADWEAQNEDLLTVQADLYRANIGQLTPAATITGRQGPQGDLTVHASGGNVLGRWQHNGTSSAWKLRAYYDSIHRDDPTFHDDLDTFDVDFQQTWRPHAAHELTWGINFRATDNHNRGKVIFAVDPPSSRDELIGGFVQDQLALSEAVRLTLGTKLEHNDFSGFEVQPTVRVAWDAAPAHKLWAAVSRAVRVPTRLERDIAIDLTDAGSGPMPRLLGNADFDAEELLAYELGYRWQALDTLSLDVALFHHRYEGLASLELGTPFVDARSGRTVIPVVNRNLTDGHSEGAEMLATFVPRENWRLSASYAYIGLHLQPRGMDLNRGELLENTTPRHQVGLRSYLDLPAGLKLDAQLRHLSAIRRLQGAPAGIAVPDYTELDVRLAWQAGPHTEISLVGQNLLHDRHFEFGAPATRGGVERSVYGKVAWRF